MMVQGTQENGQLTNKKEVEQNNGLMALDMKVNMFKDLKKGKENYGFKMDQSTKENF